MPQPIDPGTDLEELADLQDGLSAERDAARSEVAHLTLQLASELRAVEAHRKRLVELALERTQQEDCIRQLFQTNKRLHEFIATKEAQINERHEQCLAMDREIDAAAQKKQDEMQDRIRHETELLVELHRTWERERAVREAETSVYQTEAARRRAALDAIRSECNDLRARETKATETLRTHRANAARAASRSEAAERAAAEAERAAEEAEARARASVAACAAAEAKARALKDRAAVLAVRETEAHMDVASQLRRVRRFECLATKFHDLGTLCALAEEAACR